jgi:hypothetical protein
MISIIAGAFTFYVLYDTMHYALHHTKLPKYIKQMKVYHMEHHFRNYEVSHLCILLLKSCELHSLLGRLWSDKSNLGLGFWN